MAGQDTLILLHEFVFRGTGSVAHATIWEELENSLQQCLVISLSLSLTHTHTLSVALCRPGVVKVGVDERVDMAGYSRTQGNTSTYSYR